jgi:membrane-associated phospholipid phosphatase
MHSPLIQLSIYVSAIFSPEMMVLVSVFLLAVAGSIVLLRGIRFKDIFKPHISPSIQSCLIIVGSAAIATVLSQGIKHLFKTARPLNMLITETGYSFPSGHATLTTAFFTAVIACMYIFHKTWPVALRKLIISLSFIITILVCASRLVLHVHRPVDVIAGIALGIISTLIMLWISKRWSGEVL